MISVVMRQDDQIDRWQVGDLARRLHFAPGPDAMTQIDVLALMQERGIGQDRQPAETDQCGGVTDEVNIALTELCRPIGGQLQGSHGVVSSRAGGDSWVVIPACWNASDTGFGVAVPAWVTGVIFRSGLVGLGVPAVHRCGGCGTRAEITSSR